MTFLELEKKCKKRRLKRYFFVFLSVLALFGGGVFLLNKTTKISKEQSVTKEQNKTSLKKISKKIFKKNEKKIDKSDESLKLVIDLNISTPKTLKKEFKKETKKEIKNKKEVNKSILNVGVLPSFETCINLSKKYLKEKNYKEALKWAKYANLQNKKAPDSWILSAKALYKMGQKQKALRILKIYYNYYPKKEIKNLIGKLSEKDNN